ncbi:hypothetical protein TURU_081679 [Turdus rufiventris]|nr:hypothetical protein TURU_081679 [Turdus rufiventris]
MLLDHPSHEIDSCGMHQVRPPVFLYWLIKAPLKRYHCLFLPQGLKNSPTICQWYVAHILSPVREEFTDAIIYNNMDDIIICASDKKYLDKAFTSTIETIQKAGFENREDKVQYTSPWKYLRLQI